EEPVADETRDGGGVADAGPPDGGRGDAPVNEAALDDAGRDASPEDAGPEDASADGGPEDAGRGSCSDGIRNGDEADVDCGGSCETCANGARCGGASDCRSERCVDAECRSPEGTHPDIVRVLDVPGRNPGGRSWADSYSVGSECYCATSFDHGIGPIEVPTPAGPRTVRDVCDALGPGPGLDGRPLYNDVQCGNGPPNDAGDEDDCPGRVDIGRDGCGHVGPSWNLGRI
ncbi:MAG: hypothetical protein AAF447_19125, partial [Myxococcota bacterium]